MMISNTTVYFAIAAYPGSLFQYLSALMVRV